MFDEASHILQNEGLTLDDLTALALTIESKKTCQTNEEIDAFTSFPKSEELEETKDFT